jgi:hypothetical protein
MSCSIPDEPLEARDEELVDGAGPVGRFLLVEVDAAVEVAAAAAAFAPSPPLCVEYRRGETPAGAVLSMSRAITN